MHLGIRVGLNRTGLNFWTAFLECVAAFDALSSLRVKKMWFQVSVPSLCKARENVNTRSYNRSGCLRAFNT